MVDYIDIFWVGGSGFLLVDNDKGIGVVVVVVDCLWVVGLSIYFLLLMMILY